MRKLTYLAVFEPSNDGYGVYFPDLPGCISFGKTYEEAHREAEDALGLHIYGMEKDGDEIPEPSKNPEISSETASGYLVSPVTIFPDIVRDELDNRKVRTNVTIPAWLKAEAEQNNINYSKLLEAAVIEYLGIDTRPRVSLKDEYDFSNARKNPYTAERINK